MPRCTAYTASSAFKRVCKKPCVEGSEFCEKHGDEAEKVEQIEHVYSKTPKRVCAKLIMSTFIVFLFVALAVLCKSSVSYPELREMMTNKYNWTMIKSTRYYIQEVKRFLFRPIDL